jgi:dTMP kinase
MFIVFEGIDGSGKSTQAKRLATFLRSEVDRPALLTCEPCRDQIGGLIRSHLFAEDAPEVDDLAMALLFRADRTHHLLKTVLPALKSGIDVVCDRYILSSLAYQSTDELPMNEVWKLNQHFRQPDYTFFIDIPIEEALRRMAAQGRNQDAFENEAKMRQVRYRYDKAIELMDSLNVVRIDGQQDEGLVHAEIVDTLFP